MKTKLWMLRLGLVVLVAANAVNLAMGCPSMALLAVLGGLLHIDLCALLLVRLYLLPEAAARTQNRPLRPASFGPLGAAK